MGVHDTPSSRTSERIRKRVKAAQDRTGRQLVGKKPPKGVMRGKRPPGPKPKKMTITTKPASVRTVIGGQTAHRRVKKAVK